MVQGALTAEQNAGQGVVIYAELFARGGCDPAEAGKGLEGGLGAGFPAGDVAAEHQAEVAMVAEHHVGRPEQAAQHRGGVAAPRLPQLLAVVAVHRDRDSRGPGGLGGADDGLGALGADGGAGA